MDFFRDVGWSLFQVATVLVIAFLFDVIQRNVLFRVHKRLERSSLWLDAAVRALVSPLSGVIWILAIESIITLIDSHHPIFFLSILPSAKNIAIVIAFTWFFFRLVKNAEMDIRRFKKFDKTTANALGKIARLIILIICILAVMQNMGVKTSSILAIGGLGTLALGFAARDLLANFFGGLMIYWDRPFKVGEWIRSSEKEIEGYVEEIGWRLTKIRTLEKRVLYIPNATFSTLSVENPSRMSHRRIKETISLSYDDIHILPIIAREIRTMLENDPRIDTQLPIIVNLTTFGPYSLDIIVESFTGVTETQAFHQVKQDVLLQIATIIDRHDATLAFPTQMIYLSDRQEPEPR